MTETSWLSLGCRAQLGTFSEFVTFVNEQRRVAAVIHDELRAFVAGERERALSVKSQYSSSVSPFQANTGVPVAAMAAAA